MYSATSRALNAYHNIGVETGVAAASPPQLILMLYQGAMTAIALAQQHLRLNNVAARGAAISKAISIIDGGLKASLDPGVGGELAANLSELYQYMARRLLHANLTHDAAALDEVRLLLQQLAGAWETLAVRTSATAAAAAHAPPARAAGPGQSAANRVAAAYGNI